MPELPEVQTTVSFLNKKLKNKKIKKVVVLSTKQFLGNPQKLVGKTIRRVERRGKLIVFVLEKKLFLLIHLKLTGQLVFAASLKDKKAIFPGPLPFAGGKVLPGKSTRIILYLFPQGAVFFNDLRKFGWMKVGGESLLKKETAALGVEPLSAEFNPQYLEKIFAKTKRAVKIVLMDQHLIAGVGNIYANEALFRAGISPQRPANKLTAEEIRKLCRAIKEVLKEGIKFRGTSAADDAYVQPNGRQGRFQKYLQVYQREGEKCFRCGGKIKRINLGGRGTFFCPRCQR